MPTSVHRSNALEIVSAPSAVIRSLVQELDDVAYHLSAGSGEFRLPPWPDEPERVEIGGRAMAESILFWREQRESALTAAVDAWLAAGAKRLVLEAIGAPGPDDLAFLEACRRRLPEPSPPILVLLHEPSSADRPGEEVLLALLLAGGSMTAPQFGALAASRGWDPSVVDSLTVTRGTLRTYAGADEWRIAHRIHPIGDLADAVVATCPRIPNATVLLAADPVRALPAFRVRGGGPAGVAAYANRLLRAGVPKHVAGTVRLAADLAGRSRVAPDAADLVLGTAERLGIDGPVRSLFAYVLGQLLAKDPDPARKTAGLRCFDYVRACDAENPEAGASRAAAAYNGAGLALLGAGDAEGAVRAELAGLQLPGIPYEQRILLLTNLAKVYRRLGETRRALDSAWEAWRLAESRESLDGLAYVAADLVRGLIGAGEPREAEVVAKTLLRRFDATRFPGRTAEHAAVACCLALADLSRETAAQWYAEAVRRMHRGIPEVVGGIIENLGADGAVIEFLRAEQAAHRATVEDLRALRALAADGD